MSLCGYCALWASLIESSLSIKHCYTWLMLIPLFIDLLFKNTILAERREREIFSPTPLKAFDVGHVVEQLSTRIEKAMQ